MSHSAHLDNNLNAKDWADAFLAENKGKKITKEIIQLWLQRALLTGTICGAGLKATVDSGGNIHAKIDEYRGSERQVPPPVDTVPFAEEELPKQEDYIQTFEDGPIKLQKELQEGDVLTGPKLENSNPKGFEESDVTSTQFQNAVNQAKHELNQHQHNVPSIQEGKDMAKVGGIQMKTAFINVKKPGIY